MEILLNALTSKRLTRLALLSWLISIVYSGIFIHPKVDDGIYLVPAISTLTINFPVINFSDSVEPVFFVFPTQPFLHGVFLKIVDLLHVDVNIYSYRLFNSLLVALLLLLTVELFRSVFTRSEKQILAANLSLILLACFSQFSLQFFVNRPENLGLVFFILGLIYLLKFFKNIGHVKYMHIAALQFGLSSTVHPNFLLLSIPLLAYFAYLVQGSKKKYVFIKSLSVFLFPVSILCFWFLVNFEVASDQLFNRIQEVSSNKFPSLEHMFSVLSGDEAIGVMHNIYLQIHMLTLVLMLPLLLFYLFKRPNFDKNLRSYKLFQILGIGILLLLLLMQPYRPNFSLVSYLIVIALSFFIVCNLSSIGKIDLSPKKKSFLRSILVICFSIVPLSTVALHAAKKHASNDEYDNHYKTLNELAPYLRDHQHIFITTAQLLPLFSGYIYNDFQNIAKNEKRTVHWYFPTADTSQGSMKKIMLQDIENEKKIMSNALWGALKKSVMFDESKSIACLSLKGGLDIGVINLHNPKVVFQDRQNVFLTSPEARPSGKCFNH